MIIEFVSNLLLLCLGVALFTRVVNLFSVAGYCIKQKSIGFGFLIEVIYSNEHSVRCNARCFDLKLLKICEI